MPPMFSEVSVSALSHPHTIACPYKYTQILELLRLSYKARAYLPSLGNLIILGKKNITYNLSNERLNPVLHLLNLTSWVTGNPICSVPFSKLVFSPFPLLSSHLFWSSVWIKHMLNRSWLNERLFEDGSSIKLLNSIFHSALMI